MSNDESEAGPCPACGGRVASMGTCHTYPSTDANGKQRWMACMGCYSAWEYYCTNEDCGWSYVDGLNPRSPRAEANATRRPSWLAVSR